jgi:hypothetical protein
VPEQVQIPLSDLLLDHENPRIKDTSDSQQTTALALTRQQGDNLVRLAADIVEHGLDPTALPAVVATGDQRKRYTVMEGNRRLLALRALETPSLVAPALSPTAARRLLNLAAAYQENPITYVSCVLFENEEEAQHWIETRHTGQNQGVGLVEWGSEEKDRYHARHAGSRGPAGQILEFVEKHGALGPEALSSSQGVITTLQRILTTDHAREKLGVDVQDRQVIALYPTEELSRSLTRLVEDLKLRYKVHDLYTREQRVAYVDRLPRSVLPRKAKKLKAPVFLNSLTAGEAKPRPAQGRRRGRTQPTRTSVIPRTSTLNVQPPRINAIFNELTTLSVEQHPNACSVLTRVFIELSIDHFISEHQLMTEKEAREKPLSKRIKVIVAELEQNGEIPAKLARVIEAMADNQRSAVGASIFSMNQYVHNQYVYPKTHDLYATWDEIAPFMAKLWP